MPKGMQPIYSLTLSSAGYIIGFGNIPQIYTDLQLIISTRSNATISTRPIGAYFNAVGYPANTSWTTMVGSGTAASSARNSGYMNWGAVNDTTQTANVFSSHEIYIPDYTSSKHKQYRVHSVSEVNASATVQTYTVSGLWRYNSPVMSMQMDLGGDLFQAGTTFDLYGISR